MSQQNGRGSLLVVLAYAAWGLLPVYWKALADVGSLEVLAHRVAWTVVFAGLTLLGIRAARRPDSVPVADGVAVSARGRLVLVHLASGVFLSINWLTYVYAVAVGKTVEASMGYFINPLLNVLLGVVVLRERLRPTQVAAAILATSGVVVLGVGLGRLPWIALVLAVSFALYGLIKKRSAVGALPGLFLETLLVLPLALGYLAVIAARGQLSFGGGPVYRTVLLVAAGPVTSIPLFWFAAGVKRIPLSRVGFLQYLSPTLQLLVGVLVFREAFTPIHAVSFGLIWAGVALFLGSGLRGRLHKDT